MLMKFALRLLVFAAGLACIGLNIGPLYTSGEKNIGLITGLAAGTALLVYGAFFSRVNMITAKVFSYTAGRIILCAAAVIAAAALTVGGLTLTNIVRYSRDSAVKTEYVIVLGCQVNSTSPGRFLSARINAAYRYLSENPGSKAILSGGQGNDEDISEAQCMFNELTSKGIDPARLIIEEKSTSTIENFENAAAILKQSGVAIDEITVVTNDFHEYRASLIAQKNGIKAYPCPAKTPWNGYLPFAIREVYAIGYQVYLGRNALTN